MYDIHGQLAKIKNRSTSALMFINKFQLIKSLKILNRLNLVKIVRTINFVKWIDSYQAICPMIMLSN